MNQPTREEFDELVKRIEALEQASRQLQLLREDVQETNILLKKILPDVGTSRERLDSLDRGKQELKQELHSISITWLDALQENFNDLGGQIQAVQGTQDEHLDQVQKRFDNVEKVQGEQTAMLRELLNRLPPK